MLKKWDLICLVLILLTASLFFYKLGQSSLVSWDEAWYGSIAKNILISGDPLNLTWNGNPYLDHPATGFWLMALTYLLLGADNLTTRLPSAVLGVGTLIIVYLLGRELFNRWVGVVSAIALSSAPWFLYRARSGNLDIPLTFLFLSTIYLALKSIENKRWLTLFSISLGLLFLTKTMAPFSIVPALILIFYHSKVKLGDLVKPLLILLVIIVGWFGNQAINHPEFFNNYFGIGTRGGSIQSDNLANITLTLKYLHEGIGKWYWLGLGSLALSLFIKEKRLLIFLVLTVFFMLPFVFSPKGHIWHLIPLHPVLILSLFGGGFVLAQKLLSKRWYLFFIPLVFLGSYIYALQVRIIWNQFIDIPAYISDEQILSTEASKYSQQLLIDGDFDPTATFYSEKNVRKIKREELAGLFYSDTSFLMITNNWRLAEDKIPESKYRIIKADRDKVLVLH